MIKICDSSILKPFSIIFHNSLNSGIFPDNWKRSNIVLVHKNGNKQLIPNKFFFSRKAVKPFHPQVFFNEVLLERSVFQKDLGLHLDHKLNFSKHINGNISKEQERNIGH